MSNPNRPLATRIVANGTETFAEELWIDTTGELMITAVDADGTELWTTNAGESVDQRGWEAVNYDA